MSGVDLVLIPGFWLGAWSWDAVTPVLEQAGHRVRPLTLPGLASCDEDRSAIRLRDHVAAVVDVVDGLDGPVVLVGHSGGSAIAHAVADARPDAVARVIHVDAQPLGPGQAINDALPAAVARDGQALSDPRRYDIPATIICCELPSAEVRRWMDAGHERLAEAAKLRDVTWVDLPTGHWPQLTRPVELARAILAAAATGQAPAAAPGA